MTGARVAGFLPSTHGFHFSNSFPREPLFRVLGVPIGNAQSGVCGGMAYAARDLFEAGLLPPPDAEAPARGTPLFRYLVRRLFASFDLPVGPLRYLAWMLLPNGDRFGIRGVSWRTIRRQWPRVRADLDAGATVPLGLVRAKSNPMELGRNHQVLAFGYDLDEETGELAVLVYDPNHPGEDEVALRLWTGAPALATAIDYERGELPVYGFFRTRYRAGRREDLARLGSTSPG